MALDPLSLLPCLSSGLPLSSFLVCGLLLKPSVTFLHPSLPCRYLESRRLRPRGL